MFEIEGKLEGIFATIWGRPVLETDDDVVKKGIVDLRDRTQGATDDKEHVQEEGRMIFVLLLTRRSRAGSTAAIIDCIPTLEHL